jgi:hypothetical protein
MNLSIEPSVEDATKSFLTTALPTVDFFVGGSQSEFVTPRVEIHVANLRSVDPLDIIKEFGQSTIPTPLTITEQNKNTIIGSHVRFFETSIDGQPVTLLKPYEVQQLSIQNQNINVISDNGGNLWLPVNNPTIAKNRGTSWDFTVYTESQEKAKFDCDLSLTVVTDLSQGTTRANHFEIVNDTRNQMLRNTVGFNEQTLPDFDVYDINLDSTEREIDGELTVTVTSYVVRLSHHLVFIS